MIVDTHKHTQDRAQYLHQFVLHSSLDAVDDMIWATQGMFLNVVDKFNAMQVWEVWGCCTYSDGHTTPHSYNNNPGISICHSCTCQVSAAA